MRVDELTAHVLILEVVLVAEAMRLDFRRIQFTPDLVPSDITGTEIMEEDTATGARRFR